MNPDHGRAHPDLREQAAAVTHRQLLSQWLSVTAVVLLLSSGGAIGVALFIPPSEPVTIAVGMVLTAIVVSMVIGWILYRCYESGNSLTITAASWITIVRAAGLPVFVGSILWLMVSNPESSDRAIWWLPALAFGGIGLLDAIDGMIARHFNQVTSLGARLDVEIDALMFLIGAIAVISIEAAILPFVLVGLIRYSFVGHLWWRRLIGKAVSPLPTNRVRSLIAVAVLMVMWLSLSPLTSPGQSILLTTLVAIPFLANFCWDWLMVTQPH